MCRSRYHHLSIQLVKHTCMNFVIIYGILCYVVIYVNNDVSAFQTGMAAHSIIITITIVHSTIVLSSKHMQ